MPGKTYIHSLEELSLEGDSLIMPALMDFFCFFDRIKSSSSTVCQQ